MTNQQAGGPPLEGAGLTLGYHGEPVVHDAGITLGAGAITALVGPNGSGKSTLLRSLARLHRPDAGAVVLDGHDDALAMTPTAFARRVTLLSQSHPTPSGVRVRDVVGYGRHPYASRWRRTDPDGPATIDWAMDVTGVASMAGRNVDELSGGELQRVWLATCLAQRTGVLLLDEPTTYLDLRYQWELLDLLRDLAEDEGVAIGVVLHDLDHAAAVADHVALLANGRIRAVGTPEEVLTADLLTDAYGIAIAVAEDPVTGKLMTRPVSRHHTRATHPALATA
ncbi:siderophore ABC transporter ATP-binding protein CdtA [Georgenia halophila]|uniref:Siderophore ABC transporter ATP-binding protein CdtA n=1 Tax=Georgenia halophila TaxID=620889 RepID=A0ABP8L5F5_9MICO